jgi:hypothetical protein
MVAKQRWEPEGGTPRVRIAPREVRNFIVLAVLVAMTLAGVWGGGQWFAGPTSGPSSGGAIPSANGTASTSAFPTPIRHVIIVLLENQNLPKVIQYGPFEEHLRQTYAFANNYYAICHPSAPNYLSITSGNPWQCGSDLYNIYSTTDLGTLVDKAGLTWMAYDESMPKACDTVSSGLYAVRHNPFVFYSDVVTNKTFCRAHVVNSATFNSSAASGTLPALSFYTPNLCDDGHNYCGTGVNDAANRVKQSDAWLKKWLSPLLNDSVFSDSVFLITYDESLNSDAGYNGTAGGKVYFVAVSPDVRAGYTYTSNASQYNLLTTTEWLLGLGRTGHHDSWSLWPPMKSMFTSSKAGPSILTGSAPLASPSGSAGGATPSMGRGYPTLATYAPKPGGGAYARHVTGRAARFL